ncbi:MAG: enolase C-terminal domain-like protein, partial [Actinomycetota bacterium]
MKTWIDFDAAPVFAIPLTDEVAGVTVCEGMLIEGPQGWGEFSPPAGSDARRDGRWLTAAVEVGTVGWPDPVRGRVAAAVTVPSVGPDRARWIVAEAGCRTAAVRVGEGPLAADIARVQAVRDALGAGGAIRCDANGTWNVTTAAAAIGALDAAAGGCEFVAQAHAAVDTRGDHARQPAGLGHPQRPAHPAESAGIQHRHVGGLGQRTVRPVCGQRRVDGDRDVDPAAQRPPL